MHLPYTLSTRPHPLCQEIFSCAAHRLPSSTERHTVPVALHHACPALCAAGTASVGRLGPSSCWNPTPTNPMGKVCGHGPSPAMGQELFPLTSCQSCWEHNGFTGAIYTHLTHTLNAKSAPVALLPHLRPEQNCWPRSHHS